MRRSTLLMLTLLLVMPVTANAAQHADFPAATPSAQQAVVPIEAPAAAQTAVPAATSAVRDYVGTINGILPNNPSTAADTGVTLTQDEAELLDLTNQDRATEGLPALDLDPLLVTVARAHAQDMCARNYFDHEAPAPMASSPMERYLSAIGYRPDYAMVGENIYYRSLSDGLSENATDANNAFLRSPGHRANIMQPKYTKMGIGIYQDPTTGAFWVTEMFLSDQQ